MHRLYFQESRDQLRSLVLEKLRRSPPSCLTKVNLLRKISGHRLKEAGLSYDQTEIVKTVVLLGLLYRDWEEKISGKNAIYLNRWYNSYEDIGLCSCAIWPSETGQMGIPCWKYYWLLNWKASKTSPSFPFTFRGSFLDSEHTAPYTTVLRCFQPAVPSSTYDIINLMEK